MLRSLVLLKYLIVFMPVFVKGQTYKFEIQKESLQRLPFGMVNPSGWIETQMQKDMDGFLGSLDKIVPDLTNDPIYTERLHKYSKTKDLGNLKEGDIGGDEQYKWWNSETQSNWRDGYVRSILLLNDSSHQRSLNQYLSTILTSQDEDGYIGIYDKDLRYHFSSENGELWAKATLLRGLLAYYENTNDQKVWYAIKKAVDNVMTNYPIDVSNPFFAGKEFSGGVAHGLMFTDICENMYQLTRDEQYRKYVLFLYKNFSDNFSFEKDIQLKSIFNPDYKLSGHGVHTYEHLRALTIAAYSTSDTMIQKALKIYLQRIEKMLTPSGGPIGDEWIGGRMADATETGYEYCSIHELMDSYALLLQKTGKAKYGDAIERIFYNAAQGARNPNHSCIAYLKTDNSYEMTGGKNGSTYEKNQTRYKYSAAHKDAAVCCVPNAGRITPYFVQNMWMKEDEHTLVATLLGPSVLQSEVNGVPITIKVITKYPYQNRIIFRVEPAAKVTATIKIRKPQWVTQFTCNMPYEIKDNYIIIKRRFSKRTDIKLNFEAQVQKHNDLKGSKYFSYGTLIYSYPFESNEINGRKYTQEFTDYLYTPKNKIRYAYISDNDAKFDKGVIRLQLKNTLTDTVEPVILSPIGKTILRQTTF